MSSKKPIGFINAWTVPMRPRKTAVREMIELLIVTLVGINESKIWKTELQILITLQIGELQTRACISTIQPECLRVSRPYIGKREISSPSCRAIQPQKKQLPRFEFLSSMAIQVQKPWYLW